LGLSLCVDRVGLSEVAIARLLHAYRTEKKTGEIGGRESAVGHGKALSRRLGGGQDVYEGRLRLPDVRKRAIWPKLAHHYRSAGSMRLAGLSGTAATKRD
jgi:hypothetical protein